MGDDAKALVAQLAALLGLDAEMLATHIAQVAAVDVNELLALPDELLIPLARPVELGSLTCTELRLREPTGAELIVADKKGGWAFECAMIALVSGVPEPLVQKIGAKDLNRARKYIARFFD